MEVVFWHSCSKQGFSVSDLPIHSHTLMNLTYLINVLFSWQSLLFQVCSCSYSPLNPSFIKYCTINSEKTAVWKRWTRCVTIEKESRKLASPLFHSQRMLASFLPHHLPSLRRLLWNTLASCQSTFPLVDTFYWDRSFSGLSYWDNIFNKNHLPSLRRLLLNTLASCQGTFPLVDTFYWDRSF